VLLVLTLAAVLTAVPGQGVQDTGACAPPRLCPDPRVESVYLAGYTAARAAFASGGSPESLAPVRAAIAELERLAAGQHGPAEIARYVLVAAAAAAQSERDEMGLYLEHATALELEQRNANQPGPPGLSAFEASGELWLQVHRYADARQAFERARAVLGDTPRITAGLSRLAEIEAR